MSNEIIIQSLTLGVALAALLFGSFAYYRYIRSKERFSYDHDNQKADLEHLRAALERKLYELNARLLDSEDRWKDVNHLILSSISKTPDLEKVSGKVHLTSFLRAAGLKEEDMRIDPHLVFVLTPFHKDHEIAFSIITKVVHKVGLKCLRGDEEFVRGDLLTHILKLLIKARIVIINIEGRNPNVFYELGIAHAMDKPTIIVSRWHENIPFDMRTKKLIVYDSDADLEDQLRSELTRALVEQDKPIDDL